MINPENRELVIIGGSYPGAFVAWFKHLYPTKATAAWSSSGVIHAIQDFSMFDYDIFDKTSDGSWNQSSESCYSRIKSVTDTIDNIFKQEVWQKAELFSKLGGIVNPEMKHGDFMFFIADIFTMGVQYGTRTKMCEFIESDEWKRDPIAALGKYAEEKKVSAD